MRADFFAVATLRSYTMMRTRMKKYRSCNGLGPLGSPSILVSLATSCPFLIRSTINYILNVFLVHRYKDSKRDVRYHAETSNIDHIIGRSLGAGVTGVRPLQELWRPSDPSLFRRRILEPLRYPSALPPFASTRRYGTCEAPGRKLVSRFRHGASG